MTFDEQMKSALKAYLRNVYGDEFLNGVTKVTGFCETCYGEEQGVTVNYLDQFDTPEQVKIYSSLEVLIKSLADYWPIVKEV